MGHKSAEPKPRKKRCSEGDKCCGWDPCQQDEVKSGKRAPSPMTGPKTVKKYEKAVAKREH
jgi:hypothetical protein